MIDFLTVPVTLKVLAVLVSFLLFHRLTGSLAAGLALGTGVLVLWLPLAPQAAFVLAAERLGSGDNLALMGVIFGVIFLSRLMEETGLMADLVRALERLFPPRAALASLPAAIGLLPMPGGAIFSAPLIDQYDRENRLSGDAKTRINFWFRHIWECWWPLYPGVILAVDLSGIALPVFSGLMAPLTGAAVLAGALLFLQGQGYAASGAAEAGDKDSAAAGQPGLALSLGPILTVVAVFALVRALVPGAGTYLPLLLGLGASSGLILAARPLSLEKTLRLAFTWKAFHMMLIVAVVRVYGAYLEAAPGGGDSVAALMRSELASAGIPPLMLVLLLPFLTGLAMGISVGFVGVSFPIVLSLLPAAAGQPGYIPGVMAAFLAGFSGVMLSPVHVCMVVTNRHYGTPLGRSLAAVGPAMGLTALLGLVYMTVLFLLGV